MRSNHSDETPINTTGDIESSDNRVTEPAVNNNINNTPKLSLEECLFGLTLPEDDDPYCHNEEYPPILHSIPTAHTVPLVLLRKHASQGIPDERRAIVWRILLGYLPLETAHWETTLRTQRELYLSWVQDLFVRTHDTTHGQELRLQRGRRNIVHTDNKNNESMPTAVEIPAAVQEQWKKRGRDLYVLKQLTSDVNALRLQQTLIEKQQQEEDLTNAEPSAQQEQNALDVDATIDAMSEVDLNENDDEEISWNDFIESASLLDEIRKDVERTHPDLSFYLDPQLGRRRLAALERILFVWSKYNRGVKYVQGMNEIVGTLYYVLATDPNESWASFAETDTYWLLHIILADFRDVFVPSLDDAETGIQGRIATMEKLLKRHDPEVKRHLEENDVDTSFYAMRWWTTLLSREFLLPDIIRLWDCMFASTHRDNFLRYVCVTMVMVIRDQLLKGDFSTCLKLLQAYPSTHMDNLLISSRALWIYESQVAMACHKGGIRLHQALQVIKAPEGIIMAYGLRGGATTDPLSPGSDAAIQSVREATQVMASTAKDLFGRAAQSETTQHAMSKAKGWFGQASKIYSQYSARISQSNSNESRSEFSEENEAGEQFIEEEVKSETEQSSFPEEQNDDDIYINAILNA